MCVFMSCDKTVKYDDNLLFAMKLLEENPDSSYSILESITTHQKCLKEIMLYIVCC